MKIIKCDSCDKILNEDKDKYYEIGDFSFFKPKDKTISVSINRGSDIKKTIDIGNSWNFWGELHFCEVCFEKQWLYQFIKEEK